MGEYANYMLEGDDCYGCGEYLGDGDGFPRLCDACERSNNEDHQPKRKKAKK